MKAEIYKDEGYRFMGAAFEVDNDRGYGLAEERSVGLPLAKISGSTPHLNSYS